MGYTVIYTRKVRTGAYESMEIGLRHEFTSNAHYDDNFRFVRDQVEKWIEQELDRILASKGRRPGEPDKYY